MIFAAWLPLRSPFIHLLSNVTERALFLIERPSLLSGLLAQGDDIALYSYISGQERLLAVWNGANLHIYVIASLALILAVPLRSRAQRVWLAAVALGVVALVTVLICVVQMKSVAAESALNQWGLTLHTARERAFLERANRILIMMGMLVLPALCFLVSYVLFWTSSAAPTTPERRRALYAAPLLAAVTAGAASWAILASSAPPGPADQLRGLRRVRDLNPSSARPRFSLGVYYESQGLLDEAASSYREAVGLDAGLAAAHYGLGNVLFKQGALEPAAQAYREALKRDPEQVTAYQNLGIALFEQKGYAEAARSFEEVLRREPRHGAAHHDLGLTLLKLDRPCEALPHLERSAALDRTFALDGAVHAEIARLKPICRPE